MVDSADRDRLKESHAELMNLLQCDLIQGQIPILLFANKQDTKHALHPSDVARFLEFHRISTKETISNPRGSACSLILKLKTSKFPMFPELNVSNFVMTVRRGSLRLL